MQSTDDRGIDPQLLDLLRGIADIQTYAPGTELTRQGESEHTFYVIESGSAIVLRKLEGGDDQLLNTLGPRQPFGELALLDDSPRLATVRTVTETTVLEITADRFREAIHMNPELALLVTRRVLANLRKLDQLAIQDLHDKNAQLQSAYLELQRAQAELIEKQRLERELELAAEMQRNLLPAELPTFEHYHFVSYIAPARYVGGDLYDVRQIDTDHVGFLIADVADKGLHAALVMAVTRTLFFQESMRSTSPAEVARKVHEGLLALGGAARGYGKDAFVTAFYGVLHLPSGRLTYVRAGQERPVLLRKGEAPILLDGVGRFLGMLEELILKENSTVLSPGDCLLLYSDGITDAMNEHETPFGLDRLIEAMISPCESSAHADGEAIMNCLVHEIDLWRGNAAVFDDLTMLLLSVT